jgi:hypothetical protein
MKIEIRKSFQLNEVKTQYVKICGIPIYRIKIPYWKKKKPKPMTSDFTLSNGKKRAS